VGVEAVSELGFDDLMDNGDAFLTCGHDGDTWDWYRVPDSLPVHLMYGESLVKIKFFALCEKCEAGDDVKLVDIARRARTLMIYTGPDRSMN